MADSKIALLEMLRNAGIDQPEFMRMSLQEFLQDLIEAEVAAQIGAARHERTDERTTYRNGSRPKGWNTRLGSLHLQIPKLRKGTYFPGFLEPRRRSEQALASVIQEAYVLGVSTRKVDELVQSMGMTGISKSEVSRIAQKLDERAQAFRERQLDGEYPYVWLDAKYLKVREGDRVVSMALVVAIGVRSTGEREILGCDIGLSEDAPFWTEFLRGLKRRGLKGVKLAISDAHEGLRQAIEAVLVGASWQRCRVHFMRNLLSQVPKQAQAVTAAVIRTIFVQPTKQDALRQLAQVAESLRPRFPKVAEMLLTSSEDVLAYMSFPHEHWAQIHSTNPLERLNREIGRRADVVGIFPNRPAVLRLIAAVLIEQNDEWAAATRRYFSQQSMANLYANPASDATMTPSLSAIN